MSPKEREESPFQRKMFLFLKFVSRLTAAIREGVHIGCRPGFHLCRDAASGGGRGGGRRGRATWAIRSPSHPPMGRSLRNTGRGCEASELLHFNFSVYLEMDSLVMGPM